MTKEELNNIVSLFYNSPFKTFYINFERGLEFVEDFDQIFISLGITSSIKTLEHLRDSLNNIGEDFKAELAIVRTERTSNGRYLNELIQEGGISEKDQFTAPETTDNPDEIVLNREAALNFISDLEKSGEDATELKELVSTIDQKDCWDSLKITVSQAYDKERSYSYFHHYVNYRKDEETGDEYRIGIVVTLN